MANISVVINTLNEEKNLPRAIASVKGLAQEIIVCDMDSLDNTKGVAEDLGAVVYNHKPMGYVEPARNYAISKALSKWILILDADEEVGPKLWQKLQVLATKEGTDYYRIPRKNIIFGNWMKHTGWWPDLNIRFFKKGKVTWNEVIHSVPMTQGKGKDLPADEAYAIVHQNYLSIEDYLQRMNRYTTIQAEVLIKSKHKFLWKDLITKPCGEFISRYFALEGYKDGLHGLAASLLQAISEVILYLKVWQSEKFLEQTITEEEITGEYQKVKKEFDWWIIDIAIKSKNIISSFPLVVLRKISKMTKNFPGL